MNPTTQLIEAIETTINDVAIQSASSLSMWQRKFKAADIRTILLAIADAVDAQNGEDEPHDPYCNAALYHVESDCDCGAVGINEERARWRQWAGELRERAGVDISH